LPVPQYVSIVEKIKDHNMEALQMSEEGKKKKN
jgi:hypothetical protein